MRNRWGVAAIAALTVTAIAGCSASDEQQTPTPSAHPSEEPLETFDGDSLADLTLSETTLEAAPTADPDSRTDAIGLTETRLLTTRPDVENVIMLEAHDVETGQIAWDVTLWESRQIATDGGLDAGQGAGRLELSDARAQRTGGDSVFAPVFGNICADEACSAHADIDDYGGGYRAGVVALDGADGSVRWVTDLTPHLGDDVDGIGLHPEIVDASAETTLVNIDQPTGEGAVVVAALDTATGEVRWVSEGAIASAVVGGVVTAVRPDDPREPSGSLVGLDAATGDELWQTGESGSWAPRGATGSLAVVDAPDAAVVDLGTGERVRMGRFPVDPVAGGADDGAYATWIDARDGSVYTYADGAERARVSESTVSGDALVAISGDDYLWIASGGDDPEIVAADRTGMTRSDAITGEFVDVRGSSIVTVTPDRVVHLWRYAAS
ncbi:PQQ-binding-like beta-propeller repeat protein [Microbacterium faecale]|uniref:PQQ-binding-like beta-propeller repeat protein n=1 Tax=Microbacterium faecale TaxID=1804630 RepID=UPI001665746C|nr:PQQ-binding-like beta-propeller repeat protein [Microbacterium faecale]